jgi:hypothetical protein
MEQIPIPLLRMFLLSIGVASTAKSTKPEYFSTTEPIPTPEYLESVLIVSLQPLMTTTLN